MSGRTLRYILIGGLVLAIGVPSVAMGFGEGRALILGKRNPSGHRTLTKETQIIGNTSTYATRENNEGVAISRVELLYPFPQTQIEEEITRYPNLREVAWVQEEPRNMGARAHMSPRMLQMLPSSLEFGYIGRPERASPGEGYPAAHTQEQTRIIRTALDLSIPVSVNPAKAPGER